MTPKELIEKFPDYTLRQHIEAGNIIVEDGGIISSDGMLSFAKQAISLSDAYHHYWANKVCAICDIKLSELALYNISARDFLFTCEEHKKCRNMYNAEVARRELKYPPRNNNFLA